MTTLMESVQLGQTPVRVSRLGVGASPIGRQDGSVPEEQAADMIRWALHHGMNYFDTAPVYGRGESERRLGRALRGVPREQFVIQTKVGRLIQDDASVVWDFSRDGILRSLDESLVRLGMDRVDVLLVHDPYEHFQQVLDEAFPTLYELRDQGIIGGIGVGMGQFPMFWEFARRADVDCFLLAGRYTLLDQSALAFLADCQKREIAVVLGGVYNSGILAKGPGPTATYNYAPAPVEVLQKAAKIEAVCRRHGVPLPAAAVHFARSHPAVTALVLGSVSQAEAQDNVELWGLELPRSLWVDLRDQGLIDGDAPLDDIV